MQPGENFITLLEGFEGFRKCPYIDIAGHCTIGLGSTYYPSGVNVTMRDTCITHEQAVTMVMFEISQDVILINSVVKSTINQNMFDSLCSFIYNEGKEAFKESTLLRRINFNPIDPTIKDAFMQWVYIHDPKTGLPIKSKTLINRRTQEAKLYFTPIV